MQWLKHVVSALVVFVLVVILAALLYIYLGVYNVAASEPHSDAVAWLMSTAQIQSIRAHAGPLDEPLPTDSTAVWMGFEHYDVMCTTCHGAPGIEPSEIGEGLYPKPPELDEEVMAAFSDAELLWIVKHGIKMTGMPAYGATHGDEELRAITTFIKHLPDLSAEEYREMQKALEAASSGSAQENPSGSTDDDGHDHSHTH
jgi:mono/diheme cytochrome c family protein